MSSDSKIKLLEEDIVKLNERIDELVNENKRLHEKLEKYKQIILNINNIVIGIDTKNKKS